MRVYRLLEWFRKYAKRSYPSMCQRITEYAIAHNDHRLADQVILSMDEDNEEPIESPFERGA